MGRVTIIGLRGSRGKGKAIERQCSYYSTGHLLRGYCFLLALAIPRILTAAPTLRQFVPTFSPTTPPNHPYSLLPFYERAVQPA